MSGRSSSPSKRDYIKFQKYTTGLRRFERILKRWRDFPRRAAVLAFKENWESVTTAADSRMRALEADNQRRKQLDHGLVKLQHILAKAIKGELFDAWLSFVDNWEDAMELQQHPEQPEAHFRAEAAMDVMQAQSDQNRQRTYHLRIVTAADCLVQEGVPSDNELEAAEVLVWTLRAARLHRLDACMEALLNIAKTMNGASVRTAFRHFRLNCPRRRHVTRRKISKDTRGKIYASEGRHAWVLEPKKPKREEEAKGIFESFFGF